MINIHAKALSMSILSSRRNTVNDGDTIPDDPSHPLIHISDGDKGRRNNRQLRKRERNLVNSEKDRMTPVDTGSSGADAGGQQRSSDESRVTGSAGWAVSHSSHSQQKIEVDDDWEHDCHQRRRRPRTAWSDDVDVEVDSPDNPQTGLTCVDSSDDDEVDCSIVEMLTLLQRKIDADQSRLSTWKDLRAAAERDAVEARQVRHQHNPL